MSAIIYVEGGGDSKELLIRCKKGFHRLLERCGFQRGRLPHLKACGGRGATYDDFAYAHGQSKADFIAMWIDSEDPVDDLDAAWGHLAARDNWSRPDGATDEQVLFSTTCMETLIVADRDALKKHFNGRISGIRFATPGRSRDQESPRRARCARACHSGMLQRLCQGQEII